jgi:mutator protein MutT
VNISKQKQSLRQATSCFLIKDNKVLLAMKKRGFGVGKWNGPGGKPNPEESIEETAVRETYEEIGVTIKTFDRVATLDFFFPSDKEKHGWNQQVCVYLVKSWEGEPTETEEMMPKWFKFSEIPYKDMWVDDIYWLPQVLKGKKLKGTFTFASDESLQNFEVIEI